ncbi:MAG: hypothetical protein IJC71_05455 [Clostridia bacterium]|nr:hypothetical protein [Clostridia bacterium]
MKVIDVYRQYFAAQCVYNGVERKGALVTLTATSDSGMITYEAGVTFFPHRDEQDFGISYDAYTSRVLYSAKGRRSKKRDAAMLSVIRETVDACAADVGGTIDWDHPLREAEFG